MEPKTPLGQPREPIHQTENAQGKALSSPSQVFGLASVGFSFLLKTLGGRPPWLHAAPALAVFPMVLNIAHERIAERTNEKIVEVTEQIIDVAMPQVVEEIVELQIREGIMEAIRPVPQEHSHHRIEEQIV